MKIPRFPVVRLSFITALAMVACLTLPAAEKPNIVFILADDIGFGDLGCYGATLVKTPKLDALATAGCRFTDAHSPASTCTPSRRAFLTGTYSWRQKPGSAIAPGDAPASILPETPTVASLLKKAGYRTGMVGKWHLGLGPDGGPDWNGEIRPGPLEIGFDSAFFMPATGDRTPCVYIRDRRVVGLDPKDPISVSYKQKVGSDPTGKENPDLLRLKPTLGHDMTIVDGVSRIGWMTGGQAARWKDQDMADTWAREAIRFVESAKDTPFFLYLATHGIHVPRVPHQRFAGKSQAGTRGDAIEELDDTVGQVLAALDRLKLTDHTLVIFTSDNGGVNDDGYEDFGPATHRMNGTLRGTKGTLFEGGHRVPFIARWPGKIKPGSQSPSLIAHLDMPATFAAISGTALPADGCLDSVNVLPALLGGASDRKNFIAHNGGVDGPFMIRSGSWKLIMPRKSGTAAPNGQLFDLATDPAETDNRIDRDRQQAAELVRLFDDTRTSGRTRPL